MPVESKTAALDGNNKRNFQKTAWIRLRERLTKFPMARTISTRALQSISKVTGGRATRGNLPSCVYCFHKRLGEVFATYALKCAHCDGLPTRSARDLWIFTATACRHFWKVAFILSIEGLR